MRLSAPLREFVPIFVLPLQLPFTSSTIGVFEFTGAGLPLPPTPHYSTLLALVHTCRI